MKTITLILSTTLAGWVGAAALATELSPLEAESLHDIELPAPDEYRLLVDGRIFSGSVTDQSGLGPVCRADNDQVELTLSGTADARSRLLVRRVRPGEASYRVGEVGSANAGPHELPMVRVVQDEQLTATAVGELYALDEHPDALTGPFELAVICP